MNLDTKIDITTMLTFAQLKAKIESDVDAFIKDNEFATLRDLFEVLARGSIEKWDYLKDDIKNALKKYDYWRGIWYYKPLREVKCHYCKHTFKTKSKGQWFCCQRCKELYNAKEHYLNG